MPPSIYRTNDHRDRAPETLIIVSICRRELFSESVLHETDSRNDFHRAVFHRQEISSISSFAREKLQLDNLTAIYAFTCN